mgnify:FL=1
MKQTSTIDKEWVFIVLHSETLFFQVHTDEKPKPRKPRWVRLVLRAIKAGGKVYKLTT